MILEEKGKRWEITKGVKKVHQEGTYLTSPVAHLSVLGRSSKEY